MAGYSNSKDKLAYFKDNRQASDNPEDFDINKYYYNREGVITSDQMQPHMHGENRGYNGYMQQGGPNYSMHGQQQSHLMSQQRPGMPPMARSQSGGGAPEWRPNMQQKGGESHYMTNPPSMQRASTAPYGPGGVMQSPNQPMGMGGMGNMYRGDMHGQPQMGGYGGGGISHGRTISDTNLPYDASNFPVLQGSGGQGGNSKHWYPSNLPPGQSPSLGNGMHGREEEFTIQNEDFPALPGSQPRMGTGTAIGRESGSSSVGGQAPHSESDGNRSQPAHHAQSPLRPGQSGGKPSPQLGPQNPPSSPSLSSQPAGTMSMGIGFGGGMMGNHAPPSPGLQPIPAPSTAPVSVEAKYGLMGLLDVVKMTDRDLNTLALGSDLTTFGLNLNSAEPLYSTFNSPFTDQPAPVEPQYKTPACYHMHPPTLKAEHLTKFQSTAAIELHRREWRYHAELRVWLKARSAQEMMQGQPGVQFVFFDATTWEARLFTTATRVPLEQGFLTDEELRIKLAQPSSAAAAASSQETPSQGQTSSQTHGQASQQSGHSATAKGPSPGAGQRA